MLLDLDKTRSKDPIMGRKADEAMMSLCTFLKDNKAKVQPASVERTLQTLKGLKLRPYWNYCREHMLDVGLEF